ncbi:MAG: DUF2889 domain-containing protein [Deltaproteobacteria bacterium]|nr:DUF2889 domain-containing protein [Deltaproteobacteria bacterium]
MDGDCLTVRTIRIGTRRGGEANVIEVTGNLIDELPGRGETAKEVHNLTVRLRVRCPEFEIVGVETEFAVHPQDECRQVIPAMQSLVGLRIAGGFTRAVQERLGRYRGCTHIVSLVLAFGTPVHQAAMTLFQPKEPEAAFFEPLIDSCLVWRRGGELHRRVQRGDLPQLEALA